MKDIPENFLQYLWKYRLFNENSLFSDLGKVEVIDAGEENQGSGPDFFNARIRINGTVWAGNVEIHTRASDWFRHGHHEDPAYSNVILHLVRDADCRLERPGGEIIPTVIMDYDPGILEKYLELTLNNESISCRSHLGEILPVQWAEWTSRLLVERLEDKTAVVNGILRENKYDWEETLYKLTGKSFGFKSNASPFEMLVRSIPLHTLLKYRKQPLTVNAILYGQAGFLEDLISEDEYYCALQKEYRSIRKTLPVRIVDKFIWKFKGSRPANFPLVRISQFAAFICGYYPVFSSLLENMNLPVWQRLLELGTEEYWNHHYLFGKPGRERKISMGEDAINSVILNAFIPVFFSYASFRNRQDLKDKLLQIIENLPAEKNSIMDRWEKAGIIPHSASESQSLIQLTSKYCSKRKCLECAIGSRLIR